MKNKIKFELKDIQYCISENTAENDLVMTAMPLKPILVRFNGTHRNKSFIWISDS